MGSYKNNEIAYYNGFVLFYFTLKQHIFNKLL